jgi:hypothetical protein
MAHFGEKKDLFGKNCQRVVGTNFLAFPAKIALVIIDLWDPDRCRLSVGYISFQKYLRVGFLDIAIKELSVFKGKRQIHRYGSFSGTAFTARHRNDHCGFSAMIV